MRELAIGALRGKFSGRIVPAGAFSFDRRLIRLEGPIRMIRGVRGIDVSMSQAKYLAKWLQEILAEQGLTQTDNQKEIDQNG